MMIIKSHLQRCMEQVIQYLKILKQPVLMAKQSQLNLQEHMEQLRLKQLELTTLPRQQLTMQTTLLQRFLQQTHCSQSIQEKDSHSRLPFLAQSVIFTTSRRQTQQLPIHLMKKPIRINF